MSAPQATQHYIGLMSGTSLDGVDAVLAAFAPDSTLQVLDHAFAPFEPALRAELLALNTPGDNELHRAALAANGVARAYADLALTLAGRHPTLTIRALGAHGQTVRHRPGEFDGCGYTVQLLNASLLAERCGIAVVADLRSRDVAAGGQGAPLVPAFHQAVFAGRCEAVLNIGGISNISLLSPSPGDPPRGFDCGPGNCLMDFWIQQHRGLPYDADGAWAAQGQVLPELMSRLLDEPFFRLPPPRSTGRDLFNPVWLQARLNELPGPAAPEDVQATLLELTALSIAQALLAHGGVSGRLAVCGGGALNRRLLQRLAAALPDWTPQPSDALGLPAMQVEAAAFAWLALRHCQGLAGNLPAVTGAQGPRILGAWHPA
ncbi:anhydro-N-acetylmuramic acid kinase [Mitsuaria sp. WAJ17]|uniref:anhydro-N-acetylmuramic acid kinase n=1 Tax=Mitsuaria sp. WAJ17 TaxID=2761452 RepID=UPI001601EA20|nr:anhydro-N-acetylmuramic acid kinase [Mitsuaria sp. WAJ17]MBB2484930.1 anhydro-N-acetylmuramic acid kinase [Mitsuaria sp. WAJ17]